MEVHLAQLGQGLVRRGFQVAAICDLRDEIEPLRTALAAGGVEVHGIPARAGTRYGAAERLRAMVQALRCHPGAILHGHYAAHWGGDLGIVAARLGQVRAIVRTEHNPPILPITSSQKVRDRVRCQFYSKIICVSESNRQQFVSQLDRSPHKMKVIYNGVDLERFSPAAVSADVRVELGWNPSTPVIGTVAALQEERKGINYFLEMAASVSKCYPAARFLVVGDGGLRPALERQAAQLGISEKVRFTGARSDIPNVLAAMQVFVIPSTFEGAPYAILEAMAMARPVVATPAGNAAEIISDRESGMLVPIADSHALTRAVTELLADPSFAAGVGSQGREVIRRRCSLDAMVDNIVSVYDDLS